ncbi:MULTISPECIES: hypothetical protein [unclassified Streptomyces]|jgi:hypothetical protein|uniref:hypothetical protein n=1 Tax=unclassified Streptomyces TaxID=2593676 RepID=UPI0036FBBE73
MGVFAKLFRRSETPAQAEQTTDEPNERTATEAETTETTQGPESAQAAEDGAGEKGEGGAEAAGIPQQQSAEAAADSEAGEGAHT